MDPATREYERRFPGWSSFSARTKFMILARKQQAPKRIRHHVSAPEFAPPPGFFQSRAICNMMGVCRSAVAKWVATGKVRSYREDRHVAFCLDDIKAVAEAASRVRKGNSWFNREEKKHAEQEKQDRG